MVDVVYVADVADWYEIVCSSRERARRGKSPLDDPCYMRSFISRMFKGTGEQ